MITTITLNTALDRTIEVPDFKVGAVASGSAIAEQPAGKGVNVSRCLATYGIHSALTGFVGSLEVPLYHNSFRSSGVQTLLVPVEGRTRFDTTILDPKNNTETHIREKGFYVTETDLRKLEVVLKRIIDPNEIVALCGSMPPGVSRGDFAKIVRQCVGKPARVLVDTSGEPLKAAVDAGPYAIKPNVDELRDLVGMELKDRLEIAEAALSLTPRITVVIVSLGKDGALLVKGGAVWHGLCPLDQARMVNTVGCGDALVAGFLAGLEKEMTDEETLRLAVAFGAAAALTSTAGSVRREDIDEMGQQATVEKIT
ncbi:MAG: 1-phosphofructokinase family hexose kinase [Planctomycetota bacterium]